MSVWNRGAAVKFCGMSLEEKRTLYLLVPRTNIGEYRIGNGCRNVPVAFLFSNKEKPGGMDKFRTINEQVRDFA